MDVLRLDETTGKSSIVYPEDCQICGWCRDYCPVDALIITPYKYLERLTAWA
jgi:NAD-dependent dihydropyrimidine dehydrogenase PreA subunit